MLGCQAIALPSNKLIVPKCLLSLVLPVGNIGLDSKAQLPNVFLSMFAWNGFIIYDDVESPVCHPSEKGDLTIGGSTLF